MGPKQGFLNLLKNSIINFYWICSIMKIYLIYCVPVQMQNLGKFLFLRYVPKCSQPMRLQGFLINHIFRTNHQNSLIFFLLIQIHIKFWVGMNRNGYGQFGHRTLKLTVSREQIDRTN